MCLHRFLMVVFNFSAGWVKQNKSKSKNGIEGQVVLETNNIDFAAASFHKYIKSQNKHYPVRKLDPSEHSELNVHLWCTLPLSILWGRWIYTGLSFMHHCKKLIWKKHDICLKYFFSKTLSRINQIYSCFFLCNNFWIFLFNCPFLLFFRMLLYHQ